MEVAFCQSNLWSQQASAGLSCWTGTISGTAPIVGTTTQPYTILGTWDGTHLRGREVPGSGAMQEGGWVRNANTYLRWRGCAAGLCGWAWMSVFTVDIDVPAALAGGAVDTFTVAAC